MLNPSSRILLVEDVPSIQFAHKNLLESLGHDVVIATTGEEALACCKQKFDLIFMDVDLPDIDGLTTTRLIRQTRNPNKSTPIVALTASTTDGLLDDCLGAGMDDFEAKPTSAEKLAAIIKRWVTSHNADLDKLIGIRTKDLLNRQAMWLFSRKGFHGTSIRDLSEHCNISKATIYSHYDTKEAVAIAAVETFERELFGLLLDSEFDNNVSIGQRIAKLTILFQRLKKYHPYGFVIVALAAEMPSLPKLLQERLTQCYRSILLELGMIFKHDNQSQAISENLVANILGNLLLTRIFDTPNHRITIGRPFADINFKQLTNVIERSYCEKVLY